MEFRVSVSGFRVSDVGFWVYVGGLNGSAFSFRMLGPRPPN